MKSKIFIFIFTIGMFFAGFAYKTQAASWAAQEHGYSVKLVGQLQLNTLANQATDYITENSSEFFRLYNKSSFTNKVLHFFASTNLNRYVLRLSTYSKTQWHQFTIAWNNSPLVEELQLSV